MGKYNFRLCFSGDQSRVVISAISTRQARSADLSVHQAKNPTTVGQMMAQIRELQNKVNSLSDA